MIKLGNIQYLPEWRIILGGKYAVWDIALKWKAVWTEKSGSNKTHKDFWNFDLNHKNSETKWEIKYCESSLYITTMTVVMH